MSEKKHTPTPWHRNIAPAAKYTTIWSGRNTHVLRLVTDGLDPQEVEMNADFIISAVNSHDELVEVLEQILEHDCPPEKLWAGDSACSTYPNPRLVNARAALHKAKAAS